MRLFLLSILFTSASNLASAENPTHEADSDWAYESSKRWYHGEVSNAEVINSERSRLVSGRPSYTVAVVSVNGMVCDFAPEASRKRSPKTLM